VVDLRTNIVSQGVNGSATGVSGRLQRTGTSMLRFGVRAVRVETGAWVGKLLSSPMRFASILAIIFIYYLFLLSNGTFALFVPELLSRVFDNMLVHLLRGEFTVDRDVIDFEAFTRNGKTYTYFGIFPALLRLVAMPFTNIAHVELARASCLTAVVIFVGLQLRMLLNVHKSLPPAIRASDFLAVMAAATVLSGPQLYILGTAEIYQEAILWSAAQAAAFNLIVLRAALRPHGLRSRDLVFLAILAGLAINTRPTIGVALYLGTVLLVMWMAWRQHRPEWLSSVSGISVRSAVWALVRDPSILRPIVVLGLLGAAAGLVNFERWGNPLTFADFHYNYWIQRSHSRIAALENYGDINLGRIWIGALYYGTGLPYVLRDVPPFDEYLRARLTAIEAPPIIPLFTNPLTILLAGIGLYYLWSRPQLPAPDGAAILRFALIGNASAAVLIFAAGGLAMRYRFDLAPFMTLAALVGYRSISLTAAESSQTRRKRVRIAAIGLCVLGILVSHYVLLIHKVWSIGEPMEIRRALAVFAPFAFKP